MLKNVFILNFLKLYNMVWKLAIPLLSGNSRLKQGLAARISPDLLPDADIWIQAASAGEARLSASIVNAMNPSKKLSILVTSLTLQGMDILKEQLKPSHLTPNVSIEIHWFPFDKPDIMKTAVRKVNPAVMVLLETELWPGLLFCLKENRTKIIIANARLSAKSARLYRLTRFIWKQISPDVILATSQKDANRYGQIFQTAKIQTMHNIKFEALTLQNQVDPLENTLKKFIPPSIPLTILASVRKQEEAMGMKMIRYLLKKYPDQVIAVFPRHMHRIKAWERSLTKQKIEYRLRSKLRSPVQKKQVVLWDTFGELNTACAFASTVFVGASLVPLGGQNFLEPMLHGALTVTGPHCDDFQWAAGAAFKDNLVVRKNSWKQVADTILKGLSEESIATRQKRKSNARERIKNYHGGSETVCTEILKSFDASCK